MDLGEKWLYRANMEARERQARARPPTNFVGLLLERESRLSSPVNLIVDSF